MDDPNVIRTILDFPDIFAEASRLPKTGTLATNSEMFSYLDIDDGYITRLTPILQNKFPDVSQPDYFGLNSIGAHISIIYPNENTPLRREDLGKKYTFQIADLTRAELNSKCYYVLSIICPELLALRHKYGLPDQLNLNGALVNLHITIATAY